MASHLTSLELFVKFEDNYITRIKQKLQHERPVAE